VGAHIVDLVWPKLGVGYGVHDRPPRALAGRVRRADVVSVGGEAGADGEIAGDVKRDVAAAGAPRAGGGERLRIGQAEAARARVGEDAEVGDQVGIAERCSAGRRAGQRSGCADGGAAGLGDGAA